MSSRRARSWSWSCALVAGACNIELSNEQGVDEDASVDVRPVERAAVPPPPITGGTLMVTHDGAFALASDPDRDVVHVVELATLRETATIELDAGDRPFRAAEDAAGRVHVTLRGSGRLATIDPRAGRLLATSAVCPNPRGIAHDAERDALLVACAGGELVELAAGEHRELRRRWLALDLRDVFVDRGTIYVSRFRAAEVLEVRDDDTTQDGAPSSPNVGGVLRTPGTAWRTVPRPGGGWIMLHQLANTRPLPAPLPGTGGSLVVRDEGGYGGPSPCSGASSPGITASLDYGVLVGSGAISNIALAVDVAIAPDGSTFVVASPSQHERVDISLPLGSLTRYRMNDLGDPDHCREPGPTAVLEDDDFVAVAFAPDGTLLALTRETPELHVFITPNEAARVVPLAGEPIRDTGHALFHLDAGQGVACAACHPEGGDDGRVWAFADHGPRRTQALDVGIADTAPFHWGGDMADLATLVHEVRERRMGGASLSDEHVGALADWLITLPSPNRERVATDVLANAGAVLFDELGCRSCHSGEALTNNLAADLGRGALQVPNLHAVATRPPYMHDGRCATLRCATEDMLASTRPEAVDDGSLDALVAYLESL